MNKLIKEIEKKVQSKKQIENNHCKSASSFRDDDYNHSDYWDSNYWDDEYDECDGSYPDHDNY